MDASPLLLLGVTDRHAMHGDFLDAVEAALEGGVRSIWLREKDLPASDLFRLAEKIRERADAHSAKLIISDRVDVARAVDAYAVHLGWKSMPITAARKVVGDTLVIGFSAHNLKEAEKAQAQGADYITCSPIFPTPSKKGLVAPLGLDGLQLITSRITIPVVALGGITAETTPVCLAAGACGVAAIRSIFGAKDIRAAASAFARAFPLPGHSKTR